MAIQATSKQIFFYIFKTTRTFPMALGVMVWVATIWAIDLSLRPYVLKIILNKLNIVSEQNVFQELTFPILAYLGLYFILTTSYRMYGYFVELKSIPKMREKISNQALELLIDKSPSYFQNSFLGSIANKVDHLRTDIPEIIQIIIDRFLSHGLALVIAIVTLWHVNYRFAVFIALWTCCFTLGAFLFSKRLARLSENWSEFGSLITGKIVDTLSNILSVQLFTGKHIEKRTLSHTFSKAVLAEEKLEWSYLWMWMILGYSFLCLQAFNFYFLLKGRSEGWITVGDFALVLLINISIIEFLWGLAKDFSRFSKLMGRIGQALNIILDRPLLEDSPQATPLNLTHGQICFDHVGFYYHKDQPIFKDLSITLNAGEKIGLVGYSGSGKSTFVNLILRLHDVTEGQLMIDGQNIKDITQESLHGHIGMIPQDPSLFCRSLWENIRYGRPDASDEDVMNAAKDAYAHDFIMRTAEGYDALVGERGVKLSGGQRQRIAIARAILKNAPILILDEATSALDSVTESQIQRSLWNLMQGKTTLVIAHRLSTLMNMDRILVFDKGQIIEDGSHIDLLKQNGFYKTLWEAQTEGFLPDKAEQ